MLEVSERGAGVVAALTEGAQPVGASAGERTEEGASRVAGEACLGEAVTSDAGAVQPEPSSAQVTTSVVG